jgi:uncharacterized membrane protein YvbJ
MEKENMVYREQYLRKFCPKCETINSYKARFCYKCGEDLDKYPESKTKVDMLDTRENVPDKITSLRKKLRIREIFILTIVSILFFTLKMIFHF